MRLLPNCGCDSRQEIIFDYGNVGVAESAILAGALIFLALAYKINRR